MSEQRTRHLIKIGICLPQRKLDGHWLAVNYLESASRSYRRAARQMA